MIEAVIFDMDGLLIDSEPFWQEAQITVFKQVGVNLTKEMCMQTMGYRMDEIMVYWHERYPWRGKSFKELEVEVYDEVEKLIISKGVPMEGVNYIIDFFKQRKIKIGLASTSPIRVIKTILNKLSIQHHFEVTHSAQFEEYGKPHPGVYITAAKKLGVQTYNCVAFEDSFNGLLAAKSARMKTVSIPDKHYKDQSKFVIADFKLKSLKEFTEDHLNILNS